MENNFLELCANDLADANSWEYFLNVKKQENPEIPEHEIIGISEEEYEDLKARTRNITFYIFKMKHKKLIVRIWTGAYIKFAFQYDLAEPHAEYGWVDLVDRTGRALRVQCDDNMEGRRQLFVRTNDVLEILPSKERKLIYYKTMVCGECKKCNVETNDFPKECPKFDFFNAILNKQMMEEQFFEEYFKLPEDKK